MPIGPGASGRGTSVSAAILTEAKKKKGAQPVNGGGKGGSATNNTIYNNPNFDPRIYKLSYPMQDGANVSTLQRGFMAWALKVGGWGGFGGAIPTVHFLYNPTTATASYSTDVNDMTVDQMYTSPAAAGLPTMGMNQVISFALLFDRSFELWGSYGPDGEPKAPASGLQGSNDPSVVGVDADVLAMKQLAGMFWASAASRKTAAQQIAQGPMMMIPTYLNFGKLSSGQSYYGFVSSFTVTYTHWSLNMVPMRCTVDVDFTLLIPPQLQASTSKFQSNISTINDVVNNSAFFGWTTQQLGLMSGGSPDGSQGTSSGTGGR